MEPQAQAHQLGGAGGRAGLGVVERGARRQRGVVERDAEAVAAVGQAGIDLEPSDDVTTVTAAWMRVKTPATRLRRAAAGLGTFEYGAFVSHRWQDRDVPADYLPTAGAAPTIGPDDLMVRGFTARSVGAWARVQGPGLRLEAEGSYAHARVDQPSLVPGVLLDQAATSDQFGLALESEAALGRHRLGLDAGVASGDDAPGFGAFPVPGAPSPRPGDVDGPQADPPGDTTVDNFRFHPDYHVDRILFRELIGTVTDAAYVRPHARLELADLGHARIEASVAVIAAWAMSPTSTPSGARFLGVEVDPRLSIDSALLGVMRLDASGLALLGVVSPEAGVTRTELTYDPPVPLLPTPLGPSASWTTSSTVSGVAVGVASFYSERYQARVDAVGTMTTPFGAFPVPRLRWRACGAPLQCTRVAVPLDWSHPKGTKISLSLAKLPATSKARKLGTMPGWRSCSHATKPVTSILCVWHCRQAQAWPSCVT